MGQRGASRGLPEVPRARHEGSTIATWLDSSPDFVDGYQTILIGKYLNRYGLDRYGNNTPTTPVPPGWDRWHAWQGLYGGTDTSYKINENGRESLGE